MRLELHPDGADYFDSWCKQPTTTPEDIEAVSRLLLEYSEQQSWQNRWINRRAVADRNITVVTIRNGLFVNLLRFTGERENEFSRQKSVSRITVRTTPVSDVALADPKRDCAMLPADLSLKAARQIARWYEEHKDDAT